MTQTVENTGKTGLRETSGVGNLAPRSRTEAAGQSAFELMLNLQMIAKMPEMPGGDRLKEHVNAQEKRTAERTPRAWAQQPAQRNEAQPPASRVPGHDTNAARQAQPTPASAPSGTPATTNTTGERASTDRPGSTPITTPAQGGAPSEASGEKPTGASANDANVTGERGQGRGGALGALLNPTNAARVQTDAGRGTSAVTAVKAVTSGSGGSSGTAQHGWSAGREGSRNIAGARNQPAAPAHRPRSFEVEQQKVLAQVGRGLAAALKREGGVVTLRLKPETLGELKIKLELNQGRVEATFRAENSAARQLLESSLDALRSSLEAKGLRVDRLQVLTPDDPGQRQQGGSQREPDDRGQSPGGDREATDDGDRPGQTPGMAHEGAGTSPQADAEASAQQTAVSDARIAEDSTQASGLRPGADEMLVRVRLDAVA